MACYWFAIRIAVGIAGTLLVSAFAMPALLSAPPSPKHSDNIYAVAVSQDGTQFVSASEDNTAIVWEAKNQKAQLVLEHSVPVYDAVFAPKGKEVITADGSGAVTIWNAMNGKSVRKLNDFQGAVYSVAVSADGKWVAAGGGEDDPTVRVWEFATGKLITTLKGHTKPIYGVAFHPTKPSIASSSSDGTVRLWDWKDGKHRTLRGHTSHVYRCAFSPDGKHLATAGHDKTVRVWNVESGKELAVLKESKDPIYAVAFSPDGKQLVAGGEDRIVRRWSVPGFAPLDSVAVPGRKTVFAVVFIPGREALLAGCGDHELHVLQLK